MAGTETLVEVGGHRLKLTNLDKVLYPETGTTKGEVLDYYSRVADYLLPHARDRAATRKRWVNGVGTDDMPGSVFFEKQLPSHAPRWIARRDIEHSDGPKTYPLVNDLPTLIWLAQMAALEIHVPQWRFGRGGSRWNPDRMVLDLDPGEGAGLPECVEVAKLVRELLKAMGLDPMPVTSGSKGLHLYAALDGSQTSDQISAVAHELARALEADHPDLVVSDMKKALRGGKVLVDWSQNSASKTTIVPYSLRGRTRPTVATPRTWRELSAPDLKQLEFDEVLRRLKRPDPLAGLSAGHVDETLGVYRSMRDAAKTPEPMGGAKKMGKGDTFVIQEHRTGRAGTVLPMLATLGDIDAFTGGADWAYEMKWDGYRAIATIRHGEVWFRSRNGLDMTATYPELAALLDAVDGDAVLDGEIVALDDTGRPSFERLQQRSGLTKHGDVENARKNQTVEYFVFDALELAGESLVKLPYHERRDRVETAVREAGPVRVPGDAGSDLAKALATSKRLGLEGVMAKRRDSPYREGKRSRDWIKLKHTSTQEVVIGGWRPGKGNRADTIGSLLLGIPEGGTLRYVGRVGTGFSDAELKRLRARLDRMSRQSSPFGDVPREDARDARWVTPTLVGEVEFAEATSEGRLRAPAWKGWRPDKNPKDVVLELP